MKKRDFIYIIDNKNIDYKEVEDWELKRLEHNYKVFKKIKGVGFSDNYNTWIENRDINNLRKNLTEVKLSLGSEKIDDYFKKRYEFGNFGSKIAAKLSFGKRKYSITEIYVKNSKCEIEDVLENIMNIMLINNKNHLAINLNTNPDHFVLRSVGENVQEVLEVTGGSPLPTKFFAHYKNTEGLTSKMDKDYDLESPAAAKLEDGTIIGGVRHQIKKENNGFRFKALVEFPKLVPQKMIDEHCLHLACEFSSWIEYTINNNN